MNAEPQKEHQWLHQLVGNWTIESECVMGPDQPPMKTTGTQTVRSLGGMWVLVEGEGEMPDGGKMQSIITLGFDPAKQRFVGSFIASCMAMLWVYDGKLDAAGKVLTLNADGPSFTDPTKTVKYHDIITIVSPDHYTLTSEALGEDGKWTQFMTAHHRRTK